MRRPSMQALSPRNCRHRSCASLLGSCTLWSARSFVPVHGGFLVLLQPDLSIGRGLPSLQFRQALGHCRSGVRARLSALGCPGQHGNEGIPTACRDAMVVANWGSSPRSRNIMSLCVVDAGRWAASAQSLIEAYLCGNDDSGGSRSADHRPFDGALSPTGSVGGTTTKRLHTNRGTDDEHVPIRGDLLYATRHFHG